MSQSGSTSRFPGTNLVTFLFSLFPLLQVPTNYYYYTIWFVSLLILGSVVNLLLLGIAYYAEIHHIAYFIIVQIFGGVTQVGGVQ